MATLAPQLEAIYTNFAETVPASIKDTIDNTRIYAESKFANPVDVIKVGDRLPSFTLPSATGSPVSSTELLAKSPLLITFYRGGWCPFCNLALHALQQKLDDIRAAGVELVAITPELPDSSLSTKEKNDLKFTVLSDQGNKYARQLGIVWKQLDEMGPLFKQFGHDMEKFNGDESLEVPVPITLLVSKEGVVKNRFFDPDYRKRVEPSTVMEWILQI